MNFWQRAQAIVQKYLISFFELQFVITLMSLPVLIAWGIPISIMSPLANLIFTPLLIIFLWCSCLATICILTHIPINVFDIALDQITNLWLYILSFSNPSWLIGFPKNMLWLSIAVCLIIIIIQTYIKPSGYHNIITLGLLWIFIIAVKPYFSHTYGIQKIGSLPLWLLSTKSKKYLIDHGALCNRKNTFTNLDYTVLPELIQTTGHTTVDGIVFCKPSTKISRVAQQCCHQLNCKTIVVTTKSKCFDQAQKNLNKSITVLPAYTK